MVLETPSAVLMKSARATKNPATDSTATTTNAHAVSHSRTVSSDPAADHPNASVVVLNLAVTKYGVGFAANGAGHVWPRARAGLACCR